MTIEKEYVWLNQKYFYHKDSEFNQNGGSLEISVNSNTTDFQTYSTPTLNLSIFNDKVRYNINLKYQDVLDLLFSIKEIKSNVDSIYNNGGSEIKKIINGKNFKIGFKTSQNTGKRAVLFIIANSATDFGFIVVSYNLFLTIVELFKLFKRDYIRLPFDISNRAYLSSILDELKEIKEFDKSLPSSIIELTSSRNQEYEKIITQHSNDINVCRHEVTEENSNSSDDQDVPWVEEDIDDKSTEAQRSFENFIIDNIDKVQIPEFDKVSEKVEEEQRSFFVEDILKNDIKNLDSFLMSLTAHSNPIEKFREIISEHMNSTLPSITDEELKSACYYSKRFFIFNVQNYIRNHVQIPTSIPIIKYRPNDFSNENIDLAYDLLTLSMYIRLVKDKLINKIDDASINNSLLYLSLRIYTDIFTFSFLDNVEPDMIIKCVTKRFQSYSNKGVFNKLNELLKQYGFSEVTEMDMNNFTEQIVKKVIGQDKTKTITELHQQDYIEDKIKLPHSNDLTVDQITNEFVKAEIEKKLDIITTSKYSHEIMKILNPNYDEESNDSEEPNDDSDNWTGCLNM